MPATIQTVIIGILVVIIVAYGIRRLWRVFKGEAPSCNCGFGPRQCPLAKELQDQLPPCSGCSGLPLRAKENGDGDGGAKNDCEP